MRLSPYCALRSGRINAGCRWRNGANNGAYPRRGWHVAQFARRRLATGREMRIRPSRASDRRLEGRLGWLEIQEARCDRFRQSTSNGRRAGDRPQGSRPTVKLSLGERDAKACSGTQIAARGCRKATPRDREVPEDPQGSRGGLTASWGRKAPRLPTRHPRTRRTLAGACRRG